MLNSLKKIFALTKSREYHEVFEHGGYLVTVTTVLEIESLKNDWRGIEKNNSVPFFLTWHWISCWLKTYHPPVIIVSATYDNRVVAIGLFSSVSVIRYGFIRSLQWRLHQMGNILMDQICMEYNDFICDELHKRDAVDSCLEVLQRPKFSWDEIILPLMLNSRAEEISSTTILARTAPGSPCFAVDLSCLRHANREYLDNLTSNSRYQIKYSQRLYEEAHGSLKLHRARNREEALAFFREAGEFHKLRWPGSGYKNRHFVQFHENLIVDSFESNTINLLKIVAGNETIAIMYYQIVGRKVFFYLHGLKYDDNSKLKPGLVAHTMATEYFIQQGMNIYDYMGGVSQYKVQLAKPTENLATVIMQRPRFLFWLERQVRIIKNMFLRT